MIEAPAGIPSYFTSVPQFTQNPLQGFMSDPVYAGKRTVLVLFINGRCVESAALKRSLEAAYAAILPKARTPQHSTTAWLHTAAPQHMM